MPKLGTVPILDDISFDVVRGDRLVIIGPSGAGKTSLLRLLNRLSEISQGQIQFEGQDIRQIPATQLRQQVNLVPQESRLLGMTVHEALVYPLHLRHLPQPEIRQRLAYWSEQMHISQAWLNRREFELSVGQRQLVAIARGLIIQPQALLLDEPTSALDAGNAAHVLATLQSVAISHQMTIVMINHQLDLAQQFCSRVLYLQAGRLRHDDPAEQANWLHLKENLIQAELQEAEDWG
jgi:D-methionine transport system ATP-binding protein